MKFSVFTVGTPDYDVVETVKKLKEYGYDGVEWRVSNSVKSKPEVIPPREIWYWQYNRSTVDVDNILEEAQPVRDICEKEGIEICALATYLKTDEIHRIEKVLKAAVVMNCPKIRVNLPQYNGTVNYRDLFMKTQEEIKALEELAKKYMVKVNFEIHHGTIVPSASAAYRLVSGFDSKYIGIIYDAGNMVHEGFEQYQMGLELLGEYLDHVHIKNAAWSLKDTETEGAREWQCQWSPVEKGQVNFNKLFAALKSVGYDGYLSFEDFSNDETTDVKLKRNLEFIKELLK
ncbi:sugar phosphate isomerase/epimerase family protein [Clostridium thermarum]|uniref:sugar phosphate isomerase/epimerase family protein n=1 Tax=Clostridium thermarum TaxID=1716543 RepID=UPI0013D2D567|nr:sugar phosphate isomerase/epimerase [Clostridium thermarum]